MRRVRKAIAALHREERGLTLIELLVATALGLIVVGGAMTIFLGGVHSQPRTSSKVAAIQQARFTVDRIVRELRQGLQVPTTPTASRLEVVTYVNLTNCSGATPASTAIPCEVTYECGAAACTRTVAQPDGSAPGPAAQVASGLASTNVFTPSPPVEPTFVGITFSFESDGDPIVIGDGAALRNSAEEEA